MINDDDYSQWERETKREKESMRKGITTLAMLPIGNTFKRKNVTVTPHSPNSPFSDLSNHIHHLCREACVRSTMLHLSTYNPRDKYIVATCYRLVPLPPNNQCAHDVLHDPKPSGVRIFRNKTTKTAVHPPRIAVSVKYIFSLAADVMARSAPPGIAE
jgi:hypothetical protein